MPGRLFLTRDLAAFSGDVGVAMPTEFDQTPRPNIQPGQEVACLASDGWHQMRWGLIPQGRVNARGRPVMETLINARSETVFDKSAFDGVRRCVVPVDGWYEWTGETRRKQAWSLQHANGAFCVFAAVYDVWNAPGGRQVPQVAMVTCPPNDAVRPIHHRMGVLLGPQDVATWLSGSEKDAAALMVPWEQGELRIEKCSDPNDMA